MVGPGNGIRVEEVWVAGLLRLTTEPSLEEESAVRSTTVGPVLD